MESTANLMIFCGICRKFDKVHGKQQNAMANLETGMVHGIIHTAFKDSTNHGVIQTVFKDSMDH